MEEKKYEVGKVEISSAEYRDLIKDAVEAQMEASQQRSEKWRLESENSKLAKELEESKKKIAELESILGTLQTGLYHSYTPDPNATPYKPWWSEVTCLSNSNSKEGN